MSDRDLLVHIQRLTASTISLLEVVVGRLNSLDEKDLVGKGILARVRFNDNSNKFISEIKENNNDFDFGKFIKKIFNIFRETNVINMLKNKDKNLFIQKDDGKVVTIIPGVDLNFGYKYLLENEKDLIWQYIFLIVSTVYNAMCITNGEKINKYPYVLETLKYLEIELKKTGIMFSGKIFNPYIGLHSSEDFGVDQLISDNKLKAPIKEDISIESILNIMGVSGMIDREKLEAQLKSIDDVQINEATEKISKLLGGDQEMKDVYGTLINDIVGKLKENGLNNFDETVKQIANNARGTIGDKKMMHTAKNMKKFMKGKDDIFKNLKEGGGINEELLRSLSLPLDLLNML
jgi:hypothetical protein